ncbi:protein-glutamine gamma-glutamyltransferase [Paenibacillus sp. NPDC058071]|uniref:protein-glutamine gamma-glutamyltransferase n=1 Tax=Paenibacillus sp. NPDC058071 TaxID=3346326 RepID=UPI0036D95FB6
MIIISGRNAEQVINQLPLTGLERKIAMGKMNSPVAYRYDSPEALQFELTTRQSIVNAARALQASDAAFAIFEKSYCNLRYWTRTANGGFQLNPGVRPSDAINDIFRNGDKYGFECATAIVIIWYKAVLDVVGETVFNAYFNNLYLRDWNHDSDLWLISTHSSDESYPGDVLYFKNPDYDKDTPEWQGENVVLLDDNLYFGHGIGIESGEDIIRSLNKMREPGSTRSAHLSDLVVYPNFENLRRLAARITAELEEEVSQLADTRSIMSVIGSKQVFQ